MTKLVETLCDQARALQQGEQTASSLAEAALGKAEGFAHLNAFVALDPAYVRSQAKASDERRAGAGALSEIDGLPLAIKDNHLTKDYPTTACSNAPPREPSGIDATVVANLRAAGAVILGKTNMHEWAYGATNTTSNAGPTSNPHNPAHITGGSSGGSAVAVAVGIVAAALGSDTGGSVRIPAAACGIYGFKPSYGRASRYGVLPLSWSLDAPGPLARSLDDIELLLPYFLGVDPRDASTANARRFAPCGPGRVPKVVNLTGKGLERSNEVEQTLRRALARAEVEKTDASIPGVKHYFAAWETILHSEATAYHGPLLAKSPTGFSSVTRAHLEAGKDLTAQELLQAQKLRSRFVQGLLEHYGDWDALVLPTLPVTAPRQGDEWQRFAGRKVTTQDSMTWFCWLGNLAGLPCVTIPVSMSSGGLPIGMMLMGRPGQDEKLLSVARVFDEMG